MLDFTLTEQQRNIRELAHDFADGVLISEELAWGCAAIGTTLGTNSQIQRLVIAREIPLPRQVDEPAVERQLAAA